jgi:hypothetical protein
MGKNLIKEKEYMILEIIVSLKTLLRKPSGKNIAKEKSTIYFQLPLMSTSLDFFEASYTNVS